MATPPTTTNLHFVLFPFIAAGHMIPTLDIARILAQRGATVSVVTTPAAANRSRPVINRATEAKLKIQLLELPLPGAQVGLPEGWEDNYTSQITSEVKAKVFHAMELLEKPAEDLLRKLATPPDCIISDFFFSWTTDVARRFNIPRLVFHSQGCFFQVCLDTVLKHKILERAESDTEKILLPGLPDRVEITKLKIAGRSSRTSSSEVKRNDQQGFFVRCKQADMASDGVVANSFEELEPEYVKEFVKQRRGANVYCVGPVSLCNKDDLDIAERGSKSAIDDHYCLQWLDEREVESVLYVSLGTAPHVSTQQWIELGLGLESTNKPFIWVVRDKTKELEQWFLEQRFEERVRDRALIVHGWAPQVLILSHPSIGGFLTHCGYNSALETMCAGVPVITWPFWGDHFFTEIFMLEILKIGESLGVEEPVFSVDVENMEPLVKKEDVKRAVNRLLDESDGGEKKERKERARKVAEMAKRAMAEGGSSYLNVSSLIQDVSDFLNQKRDGI